ncbi:MAG: MjaI family restriction endonuclease [Victivallales bacterium]|jgi:hypothetical protein|nr:MjaI family restriction endonuclease [Victivallales bacterium]
MIYNISNEEIRHFNNNAPAEFPKYTSQLINLANQNAQGTRPNMVGQMSDLFPEYCNYTFEISIDNWSAWYQAKYPNALDAATDKIYSQIENLKSAINLIDRNMVREWVEDLVISKTYNGIYIQKAILAYLARHNNCNYRMSGPDEESMGIDGYVGDTAYSIKPDSYKTKSGLSEQISVKMIYYTKTKTGLTIDVE